jgi:FkbH-like protein
VTTFKELKRLAKADASGLPARRVALAGEAATQFLALALKGEGVRRGLALDLYEAGYDQLEAELLDPGSALYAHRPALVVLQPTAEHLAARLAHTAPEAREGLWEAELARLMALWDAIGRHAGARIVCFNYAELDDGVFGHGANKVKGSLRYQLRRLNLALMDAAAARPELFVFDLAALQAQHGRERLFDRKTHYAAAMPLALELLPEVARQLVGMLRAQEGHVAKCLVLDLDNTLWGGVVGDDGLERIEIGELGTGKVFRDIQRWAKQLRERGVLLAVCSKNDEAIAMAPFREHPEMVLGLDDVAAFVANWEPKPQNLLAIQQRLNIGLDSMVFVDDNPFERQLVRELLPAVQVPELPEDPADYLAHLAALNLFETVGLTDEDAVRTRRYQAEAKREQAQGGYESLDAFLADLGMVAASLPFDAFHAPRVAQLTQRSNQFNLRTVRYTEAEILALGASARHLGLGFTLADRFGDHGLVGVAILEETAPGRWFVDTWLMSCRVLQRGLEAFMLAQVVAGVRARGGHTLVGEYLPTAKNGLVAELLPRLGFTPADGRWALALDGFTPPATHVRPAP